MTKQEIDDQIIELIQEQELCLNDIADCERELYELKQEKQSIIDKLDMLRNLRESIKPLLPS